MTDLPTNASKECWTHIPTDLSNYYIAKKFRHGWLMQEQSSDKTVFIPRERLIEMGYIRDEKTSRPNLSRKSWEHPGVILVPTGRHQRSRSCSEDEFTTTTATGANFDLDWRKSHSDSNPIDIPGKSTSNENPKWPTARSCPTNRSINEDLSLDVFSMDELIRGILESSPDQPLRPI